MRRNGFTIIELLVVIGIISILVSLVYSILNPVEKVRLSKDIINKQNISTIGAAVYRFATLQNKGKYPAPEDLENTLISSGELKSFPTNTSETSLNCNSAEGTGAVKINGYCYNATPSGDSLQTAVVYVPMEATSNSKVCDSGSSAWYAWSGLVNKSGTICTSSPAVEPPLIITEFDDNPATPVPTPTSPFRPPPANQFQ